MSEQKEHNPLIWDLQDLMSRYGVTRSAISDWAIKNPEMKEYKGESLPKGRYNILASDLAYIEFLKDKLENMGSRAKKIEVETKKLEEQVLLLQIERFEKLKKLIPLEIVEDEVFDMFVTLRKNMQNIPGKLATELSNISDRQEIYNILRDEIDFYLRDTSDKMDALTSNDDPDFIALMESRYGGLWDCIKEVDEKEDKFLSD